MNCLSDFDELKIKKSEINMLGWPFCSLAGAETVTKALRLKNSGNLKRLLYHTTCS